MGRRRADVAATALLKLAGLRTARCGGGCRRDDSLRPWLSFASSPRRSPRQGGRGFASTSPAATANTAAAAAAAASGANRRIAVIGGGLTGLTTAYFLAKMSPSTVRITLYEGSGRLGGWIKTDSVPVDVDGTRGTVSFEKGARTLSSLNNNEWRYDDLVLYHLALDLGLPLSSPPDQPKYIYYPNRLVKLPPFAPLLPTLAEPLFFNTMWSLPGYVIRRLQLRQAEAKLPDSDYDPSIADWLHDITMGHSAGDNMVSAIIHGIYGGDIDKLSARTVLDRFWWNYYLSPPHHKGSLMPYHESVMVELMTIDPNVQKLALRPKGSLIHFGPSGMETLTIALENALRKQPNVEIKTETPVRNISYDESAQQVNVIASKSPEYGGRQPEAYDRVVSTLLSHDLASITGNTLPSLSPRNTVSLLTVNVWYPQQNLKPPGFGYLIPRAVSQKQNPERALGVFFDSDVHVVGRDEPPGTKLFVLMGGHYYDPSDPDFVAPPDSEAAAIAQAKALLERHLGIPAATPCFATASMAFDCIPQHYVGHRARMASAHWELLSAFGGQLCVTGGSYGNIGAMAGVRTGFETAGYVAQESRFSTGLERYIKDEDILSVPHSKIPVRTHFVLGTDEDDEDD